MKKAVFVHVSESKQCLIHDAFNFSFGEACFAVLHKLVDVLLHIFKNEVQVVIYPDYLLEFNNLLVIQLTEGLDLAESHTLLPRVELLLHLLDGHLFFGLDVDSFNDGTVGTITKCLDNLVLVHN